MIDLNWIIEQENKLTDKAKFELGDNYYLSLDLLKLLQSINSFSVNHEVCYYFETQIFKDFHLIILNCIRRHTLVTHLLLRHALENFVLFAYSLVHPKEKEYKIIREENDIVDFDSNLLADKAYVFFKSEYPEKSKIVEGYKQIINAYYSHGNIFSTRYNVSIIDGRIKTQVFDNYIHDYTRDILGMINEIICLILKSYGEWETKYKAFVLNADFQTKLQDCLLRQDKLKDDLIVRISEKKIVNYPLVSKILDKLNEKYKDSE